MSRTFVQADDVRELVAEQFGTSRRLVRLERLSGGTKKGVYRLLLDDLTTAVLYVWAAEENYWPAAPVVPDDPFSDASGAELFAAAQTALAGVGVRVPQLCMLARAGRYLDADVALIEDVGSVRLEHAMQQDPAAAEPQVAALGEALRRMHTTPSDHYGKIAAVNDGSASQARRPEDIIVDRSIQHLDAVAARDTRLADSHERVVAHVRSLRSAVTARSPYGLVHGELGPDHVLVSPAGEAVMIDIEGCAFFDIEWDHAWLQMRFGDTYRSLHPVAIDEARLELYQYAQTLSLIEGPLRIADTDFPDRQWMLDLAEWNITKALAAV